MGLFSTTICGISLLVIVASTSTASAGDGHPAAPGDVRTPDRSGMGQTDYRLGEGHDDYLMPGAGHVSGSMTTGVPFLALGEVAYGVSDGFAVGAIGGVTPRVGGFGLRPRGVLFRSKLERVELVVPVLYYPKTGDREPWMLARPTLSFEHAFVSGVRVSFGLGAVGASCIESLVTLGREHDRKVMGGLWNTATVGGALPILRHASVFGEATAILSGVRPAGSEWIGGPPVVVALGIETLL
jgi:hypothetical protein